MSENQLRTGERIIPDLFACSRSCPLLCEYFASAGAIAPIEINHTGSLTYLAAKQNLQLRNPNVDSLDLKRNNPCQHPKYNSLHGRQGICFIRKTTQGTGGE